MNLLTSHPLKPWDIKPSLFDFVLCQPRKEDGKSWFIKTGTTRRLAYSETIQVRHPVNFFVHPQFNVSIINYDIALIQLDKPLAMNDFVRPVCLPKALPGRGVRCMTTGWGKAKDGGQSHASGNLANIPLSDFDSVCLSVCLCLCLSSIHYHFVTQSLLLHFAFNH